MTECKGIVPVLAAPFGDPAFARQQVTLPAGMTVAEIVASVLPNLNEADLAHIRVALVSPGGSIVVPHQNWRLVRPREGVHVVIRVVPTGNDTLKSVLMIVVSVAAIALGQFWGVGLAGTFGIGSAGWQSIIGLGVTAVGGLLINALIPPAKSQEKEKPAYQISGWRNELRPDGVVPLVLGKVRYAPPFAAGSYTEIAGNDQYVRAMFLGGYGQITWTSLRIGETPIEEFDEVQTEIRAGLAGDASINLYPRQMVEENIGAELTRPYPRDNYGEVIGGSSPVETPVVRFTGLDASGALAIFAFPAGMISYDKEGKKYPMTVEIRIRQRPAGSSVWQYVELASIQRRVGEGFYVHYEWPFPSRGRWEVEFTRMTDEHTSERIQSRSTLAALQTIRPEYPLNFGQPLALLGMRIKATHQLNGALDSVNAIVSRLCPDYNAATKQWVTRETSNPASLFRFVLTSGALARPVALSGIDLTVLEDWHSFCVAKGLKYDRVIDFEIKLGELLTEIAAAGRARPRHDGLKWGVIIDRPQTLVVDHVNPRNSRNFQGTRIYTRPPHAFRVTFLDASNDYQEGERLVTWPGFGGEITETERLELPGKTDPHEIWVEARRRMYEVIHRPDSYSVAQDGPARVATRGDLVMASFDTLVRTQTATMVKAVEGSLIEIDDVVTMKAGIDYAIRFRKFSGADTIGQSIVRQVTTTAGETSLLALSGSGDLPAVGDVLHFGPLATESLPVIVAGVEAGTEMSAVYRMIDAAPIIDTLTDAETPPSWNGRVGGTVDPDVSAPPVPRITSILTGLAGTGVSNGLTVLVSPGAGSVTTARFQIDHRIVGAGSWSTTTVAAVNGGSALAGYSRGDAVEMRVRALSPTGAPSSYTTVVSATIGAGDAPSAGGLDADMVTVAPLLGGAIIMFSTSDDPATTMVQVYRSSTATLNKGTDASGPAVAVLPSRSYSTLAGDSTRENLLMDGNFSTGGTDWTLGTGWTIADGAAEHASGAAGNLSQAVAMIAGKYYRIAFTVGSYVAGNITARLSGGTNRNGTARSAGGAYVDRIQAVTGNDTFSLVASSTFDGSVDNVALYLETATCLAQGTHYFWLEPQNADGVAGPISGPFSIAVA